MRSVFRVACIGAALAVTAGQSHAETLHVLATGVFENALHDLDARFRTGQGVDVELAVVNAGEAARRVTGGQPYDLVLTSSGSIDTLTAAGRIAPGTKVDIGKMRLGMGVREGAEVPEIASADGLRAALLAAPAVAYIDPNGGGTSGVFFGKLFTQLGIADQMAAKGVPCATGTAVNDALRSGKAALGMTQASEIVGADGVRFVGFLPADQQLVTVYGAAIPTTSAAPDKAKAFIGFLTGLEGRQRLNAGGWEAMAQHQEGAFRP